MGAPSRNAVADAFNKRLDEHRENTSSQHFYW